MKVNFNLFKNSKKEKESHPDYTMSTYNKETQTSTKVGACWMKKSAKGVPFLSCQYDDAPYEPKTEKAEEPSPSIPF